MRKNYGLRYTAPLNLWLTIFFVIPISIIFVYSFLKKSTYGGVKLEFSLDAYLALNNSGVLKVVTNTLYISFIATIITVIFALPTAYYIARSKYKNMLLFLVIVPFWTNLLVRIYAWIIMLGNNGIINNILINLKIIDKEIHFLHNHYAVIVVTIYTYLPYAILPLFSSIEKFDFSLLEAARDLGATKFQSIIKVLIPNIKSGIVTATFFVFIASLGSYVIPLLVGGENSFMIGNMIEYQLKKVRNWPLASSLSVILTILTTAGVMIFVKINQSETEKLREIKNKIKNNKKIS